MKKQNRIVCSLLCSAVAALSPSVIYAQNNYWMVESGLWSEASNWKGGVPVQPPITASSNATFGKFADNFDGLQTATVDIDGNINQIQIGYGQSVHLNLVNGSDLTLSNSLVLNGGYGSGTGSSALRISATDAANISNLNLALVVIGNHANGGDGNTLTFEGAGLRVNTASQVRLGSSRSQNSLTLKDGAQMNATYQISVGHAASRTSTSYGNNNRLLVEGAGTRLLVGGGNVSALAIGSLASGDDSPISGNRADITDGAFVRAESTAPAGVATVQVGTNRYSRTSGLNVTGAGSRLEVASSNGLGIMIGATAGSGQGFNDNRGNQVTVSDGGVIKNEGSTRLTNTFGNTQNYLRIGSGGTYLASGDIDNRGGIIYLDNGGALRGETADGTASTAISINLINNTTYSASTLFLEGNGLGSTVNVNAEAGSLISIGNAANGSVSALELNSRIQMEAGSDLRFIIFSGSNAGSIDFGSTGSLGGAATLVISFAGYTARAGDEWIIFSGNTLGIDTDFSLSTSGLPTLADGLEWDLSRLSQDGGWVLGVIPEPRTSAMAVGACVLAAVLLVKRRAVKKTA